MAKQIISEIVAAENQARSIIEEANKKAEQIKQSAKQKADEDLKKAKQAAEKKVDSILFSAKQKGEAVKDKVSAQADALCLELKENAKQLKPSAIKKIIEEIGK